MRSGEGWVLICHLLADGNVLVVPACIDVIESAHRADDRGQRIELVSTIGFSKSLLLPAAKRAEIVRVPHVGHGIVGIEFESVLVFGLSSGEIPVVENFAAAQNGMGMDQSVNNRYTELPLA